MNKVRYVLSLIKWEESLTCGHNKHISDAQSLREIMCEWAMWHPFSGGIHGRATKHGSGRGVTNHVVPLIKPQYPPPTVLRGVGLVGCPHGQIPFLHSWTLCRFCLQIGAELTVNQWPWWTKWPRLKCIFSVVFKWSIRRGVSTLYEYLQVERERESETYI